MNVILAGIYGTHGQEKVASAQAGAMHSLASYAEAIALELHPGESLEKTASAYTDTYNDLVEYDVAGRSVAQAEYTEMEQSALRTGDFSALEAFHS